MRDRLIHVGREAELASLGADLDIAHREVRSLVAIVHGPAGVGKTALTEELARIVRAVSVIRHPGFDLEGDRLQSEVDALGDRDPSGTLIVLEDIHWCTSTDVRIIEALLATVHDLPVLVILTLRPPQASTALSRLLERAVRRGARWVDLRELTAGEVERFAEEVLGEAPSPRLRDWLKRAGGNPLWVTELLRGWQAGLDIDAVAPPGMRTIVRQRVASLGPQASGWVPAAAVLARFTPAILSEVASVSINTLTRGLVAAAAAGVLTEAGSHFAFRHDVLREVVYDDIPTPARAMLHRQAAEVLERASASPATRLHHVELADASTSAGRSWLIDMAIRLSSEGGAQAVPVLERAASVIGQDDARRPELLARTIAALATAARRDEAADLARALLGQDLTRDVRDLALYGLMFSLQGDDQALEQVARQVLSDPATNDETRCAALFHLAVVRVMAGRLQAAADIVDAALATGPNRHRAELESLLRAMAAMARAGEGDSRGALAACPSPASSAPRAESMVRLIRGCLLVDADQLDDAVAEMSTSAALDREREPAAVGLSHACLSYVHLLTGDLCSATVEADAAHEAVDGALDRSSALLVAAVRTRVGLLTGRDEDLDTAGRALASLPGLALFGEACAAAAATVLERRGEPARALDVLETEWRRTREARYFLTWRSALPDLVRIALAEGRTDLACEVVAVAKEGAARSGATTAAAAATRCEGLLRGDIGLLESAADLYAAGGRALDAATATEEAAWSVATVNRSRSRAFFDLAAERYAGIGASREATRLTLHVGRGRPPVRATSGWAAITPSEEQVVRLVAEGLTNRRIAAALGISHHTVDTHLRHVFAKLGVATRSSLAAIVAARAVRSDA